MGRLVSVIKLIITRQSTVINHLKDKKMRATLSKTPTETKTFTLLTNFRNSKRVQWSSYRNYR